MPPVLRCGQRGRAWMVIAVLGAAALAAASLVDVRGVAEPLLAYDVAPLPAGLDSLTSLEDAARRIEECADDCSGIVYFWSQRMPLSRSGIGEISAAARALGMRLTLVRTDEVHEYAYADPGLGTGLVPMADAMLGAGVLAHAPAVVVHDEGQVVGHAILGYKTAETYEGMIGGRVSGTTSGPDRLISTLSTTPSGNVPSSGTLLANTSPADLEGGRPLVDYEAVGTPGAYFRWVRGRQALAYESGRQIYLLDLVDGQSRLAPGYVDFIPTPDGRYFVTPGRGRDGLNFYDADRVFEAARADPPVSVVPFFADGQMRDQYPSVGILEQDESRSVYRVLTSWYAGIVYRDYEVRVDASTGVPQVRPLGESVTPCGEMSLSIPIMSQDGTEVAARDESTGTTKIFRILTGGRCVEAVDLGVQTGKVAWHRTGRLLAFARPRLRRPNRGIDESAQGIFLFDRDRRRLTRLSDSEGASRLAFPDFVGDDSVVFLIPRQSRRESSVFRVVDGIR